MYYLNVHDEGTRPNYEWVRADGRLYSEGLQLTWISPKGRATVTLDLEFCDGRLLYPQDKNKNAHGPIEVASTYSPNNPMAGEDIGTLAAKRQGALADNLYPYKLVGHIVMYHIQTLTVRGDRSTMTVLKDLLVTQPEIEYDG